MTVVVTHSTPADSSFSTTGATAWDANHTLSGVGTMAGQDANAVAITGGAIDGATVGATTPTTGAFTYASFPSQSVAPATPSTGFTQYAASTGMFSWKGTNGFIRQFDASDITADRTWVLPNTAGTIALTSNLGTIASQNSNAVAITGGSINNATVGATTASTGAFTTLSASSTVSGAGFDTYLASPPAIGGTTAAAGTFTTLTATGQTNLGGSSSAPSFRATVGDNAPNTMWIEAKGASTADAAVYLGVGGTPAKPLIIANSANAISFRTTTIGGTANQQLNIAHTASAVNYIQVTGATTASKVVAISAQGSDTDVTLSLSPKGAGTIRFGTHTGTILTPTGYITITDSGGTSRRLLVG